MSTTDNIFIMRQTLEKCYEHNIEMLVLFIDFKQTSDFVDRQNTVQMQQKLMIPNKLVRLIKMTIQNTEANMKIDNLTSEYSLSHHVCVKAVRSLQQYLIEYLTN